MIAKILFLVFLMKFSSAMYMSPDYPRHHPPPAFPFVLRPHGGHGYHGHAHHPLYFMAIRNDKDDNNNKLDYEKIKEATSRDNEKMVNSRFNLHESWNSEIEKVVTNEKGQSKQKVVKFVGQKNKTLEITKNNFYYGNQKGRNENMAISLVQDNNRHDVSRHHHHHYGNEHGYSGQYHQVAYRTKQRSEIPGGTGVGDYKMNELFNKARNALNRVNELFKEVGKSRN